MWQVPIVDISPYVNDGNEEQLSEVERAIDVANRTFGFVQIVGHGIPASVVSGLGDAMDAFFDLPLEKKLAYRSPPEINRGYTAPKSESLSLSLGVEPEAQLSDYFEAFNVGTARSDFFGLDLPAAQYPENVWPNEFPLFQSAILTYFAEAGRVARTLTRIFAHALGLDDSFFESFTDHSVDVLRMNNYTLPAGTADIEGGRKGMGEHSDFGIVTVLWADQIPGLQVLGSDRIWHDVLPVDGGLLVNLGDLTARWTNENWLSTLHRVVPPLVDGRVQRRRSAAFFHDGNIEASIATIESCRNADGSSLYGPITVGEHLAAKLAGSRGGEANTSATRESDRVRSAYSQSPY